MDILDLQHRYSSHPSIGRSAELRSIADETHPQLQAEALLGFAGRQERDGHAEVAAAIYQEMLANRESRPSDPELASVYARAQARLNALSGENASFGARTEVLMRSFAQQATEPSMLLAMGFAGAAFRMTRLATLSRLAANPSAHFLTRGLGARAVAGLSGFAVEAPVFTLTGRLGAEALGREQDWTLPAMGRDLASSYLVLGALKAGGAASEGLFRGVHRIGGLGAPTAASPLRTLFQQGGMLAGILGGHRLEELAGLRRPRVGGSNLVDGLAMLLQFNVAGRLTRQALGPRFHGWELGLEAQSEALAHANRPSSRGPFLGENAFGLQPAFAGAARAARAPRGEGSDRRPEGPQLVFMTGKGGESSSIDQTGIRVIQGVKSLRLPEKGDFWRHIRDWIEAQPHPIIVGELGMNTDVARVEMINRGFSERFGHSETSLYGKSVRKIFHSLSDSFVASRVPLLAMRLLTSNFVEYAPTRMRVLAADGSAIQAVGAGAIISVQGRKIALGIFTDIAGETPPPPVSETREVAPPTMESIAPVSAANAKAVDHFTRAREALNVDKDKK